MSPDSDRDALERLNRRLERERRARRLAEAVAERGLRDLFVWQQEIQLLETIAQAANSAGSLAETMPQALQQICQFAGWPLGRLVLVDRSDEPHAAIRPTGLWNCSPGAGGAEVQRVLDQIPLVAGAGVAGRVADSGRAAWVLDFRSDPAYAPLGGMVPAELHSMVGFPVLVGTDVVAALEFLSPASMPPDESLLTLMGRVGTQLGRIVERQRSAPHDSHRAAGGQHTGGRGCTSHGVSSGRGWATTSLPGAAEIQAPSVSSSAPMRYTAFGVARP
jgi:hypothetical protein